jgi:hypothetical protein
VRNDLKTLIAVGLGVVAVAAVAALSARSTPQPPPAPPTAAPTPAAPAVPPPAQPATAKPAGEEPGEPVALEAGASVGEVKLGGWIRGASLPLCGRSGEVALRPSPDAEPGSGTLPSCEGAYSEYPSVTLIPIRSRRGEWIQLPDGWVRIDEVRTAETLVVDGAEYWHDLFNASVERVEGRRVTLKGDTDPCAGEVCGDGHGMWEQEQELRAQLASQHPDGKIPPEALEELEQRIAEMGKAAEESHAEAVKAAEERERERRTIELPGDPGPGKKLEPQVEGGGYLCCT